VWLASAAGGARSRFVDADSKRRACEYGMADLFAQFLGWVLMEHSDLAVIGQIEHIGRNGDALPGTHARVPVGVDLHFL
jgi:hypothetical protein